MWSKSRKTELVTSVIVFIYLCVMVLTNHLYTILDDESTIISVAGHPVLPTLRLFLLGVGQHEHPPLSDLLLHGWLIATQFSFFGLRIFANIFYISAILLVALSGKRLGGTYTYWAAIAVGILWPFAFQYGRITGWYCPSMFLISLETWFYIDIVKRENRSSWIGFAVVGILLVWSNYFGIVILSLFLVDFLLFHRDLVSKRCWALALSISAIVLSFLPLLRIAYAKLGNPVSTPAANFSLKGLVASAGYPTFAIFGSAAVAPWYIPLSVPVGLAVAALLVCLWFSPGRKWFVYFSLSMIALQLSGHMNVKRVLFLLPWMFLAISLSVTQRASRFPRVAIAAVVVMIGAGWVGILSGGHYATTNLYEPWGYVAEAVAKDVRSGATVVSENYSFFFYLNYQLGLEADTQEAQGPFLGETQYKNHGYKVMGPDQWQVLGKSLKGRVVVVNGSAQTEQVMWINSLNRQLSQRCTTSGEYRAALDPALGFKREYAKGVAALPYRTDVIWYNCPGEVLNNIAQ